MEKVSLIRRKKIKDNPYSNQYSFLNRDVASVDKLNCLSLDLERLKKNTTVLPSITSERKKLINAVAEKLTLLKQKIKQKEQEKEPLNGYIENIAPFPINYSMMPMPYQQMQYPLPYPTVNMSCSQHCHHGKKKKQRKKPKKQKEQVVAVQRKTKRRNRFRICAYAVYFSIFIKYYSTRFTENRRKWFMDRYNRKDSQIIYEGSEKVLRKLHGLDFYEMSQAAKSTKHISGQTIIDWQQYTNTALIPSAGLMQKSDKGRDTVSQYIINFTELLMEKLSEMVLDEEFINEYHEVFSAGSLDLNFMIDNLYLPEQLPFLFVHPTKGYLRISYKQQIQLLLVKVMIKMVIFNFLFGLAKSKSWSKKLQSMHKLAQFQIEEMWEIARTIGIYLYTICKELYLTGVKNLIHHSNFSELAKRFGVRQAKHLEESADIRSSQDESKERKFQLIRNIKNHQITEEKINRNIRLVEYKAVLKQKIIDFLANLHDKLKKEERDLYAYIKNMTLSVPYIIFESIKAKEQQAKKNKQYKILKPNNDKSGRVWNEIYGTASNSLSTEKNKSKSKNVKFNDSQDDSHQGRLSVGTSDKNDKRNEKGDQNWKENSQNMEEKKKSSQNEGPMRADLMKKPFNIDTVNGKYNENRQQRLRQKFRNLLMKNGQSA